MYGRLRSKFRKAISLVLSVLPSRLKIAGYRLLLGYQIGSDVRVGRSLIFVDKLKIGDHVRIGNRNTLLNIPNVEIGSYSTIGDDNTFVSSWEFISPEGLRLRGNQPELIIGEHSGVSYQNYFDVQDRLTIDSFTTIAGVGSVFFTHYLEVIESKQTTRPVHVGRYCMVGSNTRFVPGASVPDFSVVAMGSVVTKEFRENYTMIGGNPARVIRNVPPDAKYFNRSTGFISSILKAPFDYDS